MRFEPSVAASLENLAQSSISPGRDYETYVRLFDEQERILSDELPMALKSAFKVSRNIRRVTFADFSRKACILGDRAENFGEVFLSRSNPDSWIHNLTDSAKRQRLPRKFGAFKLLMETLSASASLHSIEYIAVGDGVWSSENSSSSGIPHTFFSSRFEELPRGVFDGLRHLRKLDLSILVMGTTSNEDETIEVDALKELLKMADCLEELRLIGSGCPSLSMTLVCGSRTWKNLRTLELRHFELESLELLDFFRRHKHCLRKVDIDYLALVDYENRLSFCESIHVEYPNLHIAPNLWKIRSPGWRFLILGTTDAREGEAIPIDWAKLERVASNDDNYSDIDWLFGDESGSYSDNESFTSNVSTTSEELEFSTGSESDDDSDLDSKLGVTNDISTTSEGLQFSAISDNDPDLYYYT